MGELSNLEIIGIIVLILIFGGFLWRLAKGIFKIFLVAVVIIGAIYFFKPELIKEQIGTAEFEKYDKKIKDAIKDADKAVETIEPYAKGAKEYLEDSLGNKE